MKPTARIKRNNKIKIVKLKGRFYVINKAL